jgi:hypothetical protein
LITNQLKFFVDTILQKPHLSRNDKPNRLKAHHFLVSKLKALIAGQHLPEVVNAIALEIHKPARPASFVKVDIENNMVTKTDKAPKASKFRRSQQFVVQKLYRI